MALANHRKEIRAELAAFAERVRDIETAAVTMVLRANGIDLEDYPPVAISMLIAQTARSLCNESAVGVTRGHDELRAFVERQMSLLKTLRGQPPPQLGRVVALATAPASLTSANIQRTPARRLTVAAS